MSQRSNLLDFKGYQSALTRSVYPIRLELPRSSEEFVGQLSLASLGPVSMIRASATDGFHCVQQPAPRRYEDPRLILKMQISGSTSYTHSGHTLRCDAGDIALLSDGEIIEGDQHGVADALVVKIPTHLVGGVAPRIFDGLGHVVPGATGSGRLLAMTLREIWTIAQRSNRRPEDGLFASLIHLIDASIGESLASRSAQSSSRADLRFRKMSELIVARCTTPALSVDDLARELGMSRSTMYEATKAANVTVEQLVMDARVNLAKSRLTDPALLTTSITAMAYDLGFKHPSHFSRVFSARTGVSPQAYRREALAHFIDERSRRH